MDKMVYYVGGPLLGCVVILLVVVIVLCVKISKLKKNSNSNRQGSGVDGYRTDDFCFANPVIQPGEELSKRGFSMYGGAKEKVNNTAAMSNPNYSFGESKDFSSIGTQDSRKYLQ